VSSEVFLIRHAESEFNLSYDHLIGGRSNWSPLTEKGIVQAKNLGRYLLSENIIPTHVSASPAIRTLATAEYSLAEMGIDIDVQVHDALQEMSQGVYEGKNRNETYTDKVLAEIVRLKKDFKLEGGESMNDTGLRMLGWLNEVISPTTESTRHFVYTHGMAVRCLVGSMFEWSHEDIRRSVTPNTCITKLAHDGEDWKLEYYAKVPEQV
jgi:broad specificity phosphatase PhoE